MRSVTEHIRRHLFDLIGMAERKSVLDVVKFQCGWSAKFMTLMINRITIGHYRYGAKDSPVPKNLDYIASIEKRLNKYREDGNLEHMVDIANIAMLEFEESEHPKRHFKAVDDGEHII